MGEIFVFTDGEEWLVVASEKGIANFTKFYQHENVSTIPELTDVVYLTMDPVTDTILFSDGQ